MHEIEVNLDQKTIDGLCKYALKEIKNDKAALINYAANKAFEKIIETDGECLSGLKSKVKVKKKKSRGKSKKAKK